MNLSAGVVQARQHGAMEYSDAPVALDEVRRYRLERIRAQLRDKDYAGALLFDQINCRYACDATNMQIWCAHYETRCVFVAADGPLVLFDYANHPHLAEGIPTIDEYRVHSSFYYFTAGPRGEERAQKFADEIADLLRQHGGGNMRLAIDRLSEMGASALKQRGVSIHDGLAVMELARVIKSSGELALMQKSIDVCERGVRKMREATEPGMTENALWALLHHANIEHGGEWIETRLLSSGPRTFPWFRESSMRKLQAGDLISLDTDLIGPYGYCADISRAWVCADKPSDEQRRIHALACEQIAHNQALLEPGITFAEVSQRAWRIPDEFVDGRYSVLIHGVGLADEYPSIHHAHDFAAKGYDGVVEENMTLCVESYIGSQRSGQGVKLERQVLITADGARALDEDSLDAGWTL